MKIEKVIETALYCEHLDRSISFYTEILQLTPMVSDDRFCAFDVNGESLFLLFQRRGSLDPHITAGGTIPPHDGFGPIHMAFAIRKEEVGDWERRLTDYGVAIISRVEWPLGGISLYFHDPDHHVIELATPGVWKSY